MMAKNRGQRRPAKRRSNTNNGSSDPDSDSDSDSSGNKAYSADSNDQAATSSKTRTKATDLKYDPKTWESQKYAILAHFGGDMCGYVLSGDIQKPEVQPALAIDLLADMSRGGTPPTQPNIDPIYLACSSHADLSAIGFAREGPGAFKTETPSAASTPGGSNVKKEPQDQSSPGEAKSDLGEDPDQPEHGNKYTKAAWDKLNEYHSALAQFRTDHPVVDFMKHQKLCSYITSSLDSATGAQDFNLFEVHIQYKVYAELNNKIYQFLNKFIGKDYKYLKQDIAKNDGIELYRRCNIKQAKPSATSGQAVVKRMINARQHRGQEYSAYYQYIMDICSDYEEATGGLTIDDTLIRLALTERISDFYKPIMDNISTNDLTQKNITPLCGEGSIVEAMTQYEITHAKEFRQLRKKREKKPRNRRERANAASDNKRQPRHQQKGDDYVMSFDCAWCKKFRPGKPTSHTDDKCKIKADYINMTCHVCEQKGHPSKFCQDGQKGRANHADDNRSVASSRSTRSHALKRYVEPNADELNSAEAIKAIKRSHKTNKKSGRARRYKVIEVHNDSDSS